MNYTKAFQIFEKVKKRFFKNQLNHYKMQIFQEPRPFFNGRNVYVMGWQDKRINTVVFKSWTVNRDCDAFSFYVRCIHELAHALVVDIVTDEQNINHDKIWAIECLKRYMLFCKNKREFKKATTLDWWYVNGKSIRAKTLIQEWGLDKIEGLCYT